MLVRKLGAGNFGCVWEVLDGEAAEEGDAGRHRWAIKTEERRRNSQLLKMEVMVLKRLGVAGARHSCRLQGRGRDEQINYLVMTLTGPSLSKMRKRRGGAFDGVSACLISAQCLSALEELHQTGFVHRDVKPGNFAVEAGEAPSLVLLLDFGLARCVVTSRGERRRARQDAGFRGTVEYASLGAHQGREMGPKDDLESLWYQHLQLALPAALPWRRLSDRAAVEAAKRDARHSESLLGQLAQPLPDFLHYLDCLAADDAPDYADLQTLLSEALLSHGGHPQARVRWDP